jgi:hypothetical protein
VHNGDWAASGTWTSAGFSIALTPKSGTTQPVTYRGAVVDSLRLTGTWVQDGRSNELTLFKQ